MGQGACCTSVQARVNRMLAQCAGKPQVRQHTCMTFFSLRPSPPSSSSTSGTAQLQARAGENMSKLRQWRHTCVGGAAALVLQAPAGGVHCMPRAQQAEASRLHHPATKLTFPQHQSAKPVPAAHPGPHPVWLNMSSTAERSASTMATAWRCFPSYSSAAPSSAASALAAERSATSRSLLAAASVSAWCRSTSDLRLGVRKTWQQMGAWHRAV